MAYNSYHLKTIRTHLTNNIYALFPHIEEEIVAAFESEIPATNGSIIGLSIYLFVINVNAIDRMDVRRGF